MHTMDYPHHTPEISKYKHLSAHERGIIKYLTDSGLSPYAIGKKIGRAANTIRNELRRGTVKQIRVNKMIELYLPDAGQTIYERNRLNSRRKFKLLECSDFIEYVDASIRSSRVK